MRASGRSPNCWTYCLNNELQELSGSRLKIRVLRVVKPESRPVRKAVKEAEIVSIIEKHAAIYEITYTDIAETVERIAVGDEGYRIRYKDGSESIAEANRLKV